MGRLEDNIRLIRNERNEGGNTKERVAETFDLVISELNKKAGKEEGKGLSTNDFTNELKNKLEGLQQVDTSGLLPKGGYTGTAQDLKNLIDAINRILQSDDTDLDQLQEIVTYIKQNKHILSTLGISNIAGLVEALAAKAEKDHTHNWDDIQGKPNNLATTDNIKTAIEGIQIGGRNYVLDSKKRETSSFSVYGGIKWYDLSQNLEIGATYILTFKNYKTEPLFYLWNTGWGDAKEIIAGIPFTVPANYKKLFVHTKQVPYECDFEMIKLERGNKATDWSPAPEDLATHEQVMQKVTRTGYDVGADTVIPQAQQNDTVFVNASCTLGLQNIEHLGSVSFIKTFDTGAVTFTCAGKTIIMKGDTQFNGGKGSTAVVSIHNNDCYIRISNV